MLALTILSLAIVANLVTGLVVLAKNPRSVTSRYFFWLTSSLALWSLANYLSTHPIFFSQLTWIRLVLLCGGLLNLSVFLSFLAFPNPSLSHRAKVWARRAIIFSLFVLPLTLTPIVFKELHVVNGNASPVPNLGIALFMLHTITLVGGSVAILISKFRKATGRERSQLSTVLLGVIATFALILFTNLVLVILFNFTALIPLGPAFTLIFSGSFAYAIIRQRLFDVRAAVARSVTYLLSLGTIAAIYGLAVFVVLDGLLGGSVNSSSQHAYYILFAVISSFFFQPLKLFFDKLTTKLFFQDAYNSEDLLNNINKLLVGQMDLELLLKGITNLIEDTLKTSYCVFIIRETAYEPLRVVGSERHQFDADSVARLRELAPHAHRKVLVTDELGEYKEHLEGLFRSLDIAVLIRLVSNTALDLEGMGYLVIGPKKNGSIYTNQDNQVLDILSNEMVIAVENALRFEEIEKFNLTLQQKVDDATAQLKRTNAKLEKLDETKDEFISMASHQLRTPLTSVKGYLSMVLEGDAGDVSDMQRKLLDQAFVSSQRMVYLIADLLNLSRLKTGKFIIDAVPTNLAKVIEDEVGQLKETAASRNLELTYQKPPTFPTVMLDETKIRQVIMNFTDNAIYYTPAGGHIQLKLEDTGKTIEFTVNDDGIGIPKREQAHLFTKFFRAGNAKKARPDGTGLGLFMVKKVIVAQGGSLIFKSQEGKGSTFGFAFDKSKLEAAAPAATKPIDI